MKKILLILFCVIISSNVLAQDEQTSASSIGNNDIMAYLQDMAALHRQIMGLDAPQDNSRQILVSDNLRNSSIKTINYSFDFARAQSAAIDVKQAPVYGPVMDDSRRQNLKKAAANVEGRVKKAQSDLDAINEAINNPKSKNREALLATREKINSEMKLAKTQAELIENVMSMAQSNGNDDAGLLKKVNTLARSVPEIQSEQQRKNPKTDTKVVLPERVPVSASKGIIGLVSDLYSSLNKQQEIKNVAEQNAKMRQASQELLNKIRGRMRTGIKLGEDISNSTEGDVVAQKKQLDDLTLEFKQVGASIIPLNQTITWLEAGNRNLEEWQDLANQKMKEVVHVLAIRLLMLGIAIAIPVILSRVANRAINKYTKDPRWQRQLQTIRRVMFSLIIFVIIVLNLITESGSLLTFAGFLTAGLAVALQNVILSTVAYFFFFGRYGVREGDRVTIGGVTGEVTKIGIVRLYMMELAGKDSESYPTGRIVSFPNSVLFQPAAFTKLVPGTNFTWSEIRIILDPATDYDLASKKLLEAVDMVYDEYKDKIKDQQSALQRATHLFVEIPGPTGYVKFVDAGLAFVVRYPVAINESSEIHDRITKKLIDAIRAEPDLKLAA